MATANDLLLDAFGRVQSLVRSAVEGLSPEELAFRVDVDANSVAWLVWHLTRIQDDHIADVADTGQAWMADGWADRFSLPFEPADTGFGHTSEQVAAVGGTSAELLAGYHDVVHQRTARYVEGLPDGAFGQVIDTSWDPPVTLGVRLVSVVNDNTQHVGQALFVRGTVLRGR